jgi:RNA polymerase sigma-70 factor, ECF subfamily
VPAAGGRARGPMDDRRLVERAAAGDAAALRSLYERYSGLGLALALRIVGRRSEAEEVLQEAFLAVWRRAPEYDAGRGEVGAWITTIVRTRALDRVRARAAAARMVAAQAAEPAPPPPPSPLEDAERKRAREEVGAALAALPDEQRRALELAYYDGLSQTEIAARTGAPLGTVKTRIKLAVDKLAGLLGGRGLS